VFGREFLTGGVPSELACISAAWKLGRFRVHADMAMVWMAALGKDRVILHTCGY
jgi:hypothetical protein